MNTDNPAVGMGILVHENSDNNHCLWNWAHHSLTSWMIENLCSTCYMCRHLCNQVSRGFHLVGKHMFLSSFWSIHPQQMCDRDNSCHTRISANFLTPCDGVMVAKLEDDCEGNIPSLCFPFPALYLSRNQCSIFSEICCSLPSPLFLFYYLKTTSDSWLLYYNYIHFVHWDLFPFPSHWLYSKISGWWFPLKDWP